MTASLLDHIWQSTLFAAGAGLLTLLFRRNGAGVRFWLWFAASLKFLLPFAALAVIGEHLFRLFPASLPILSKSISAIQPAAAKFSAPARMLAASRGVHPDSAAQIDWVLLLLGVWAVGFGAILSLRLVRWLRLRAMTAAAQDVVLSAPAAMARVAIKTSPSLLEPGLVGILRPVILLPQGLMARLSQAERDSILAHEVGHLRRRDNVTALIHMMVETLFWFYPPVWLIGARLVAERERACDESVLAAGHDPEVYAGGILKVCKFCLRSPLACAPGASGADLNLRLRQIMTASAAMELSFAKRMLLAGAATLALVPPIMAGFPNMPLGASVKRNIIAVQARAEQAVSAVAEQVGMAPAERAIVRKLPLLKIEVAASLPVLPAMEDAPAPSDGSVAAAEPAQPPSVAARVASSPPAKEVVMALNPVGDGDPDAITCRVPQQLPGSRLAGPKVCKTNSFWAQLRANRQDLSPDGKMIVYLDDFQRQKAGAVNCRTTFFTGAGATSLAGPSTTYCF